MPGSDTRWAARGRPPASGAAGLRRGPAGSSWQRSAPRLPPGFRWIAVRPGAAPPLYRGRRSRGPTPHYTVIPRWGLADRVDLVPTQIAAPPTAGPSAKRVRATLFVGLLVLALAALVYVARYVLLVINRNTLLNSMVAFAGNALGIAASVVAIGAAVACAVTLVQWLIARRSAAFTHRGLPDPRSARALWLGCLLPLVNLLWAPVFVIELATIEEHYARLRRPIVVWWIAWVCSNVLSIYAIATRWASDAQGVANNTVMMVLAYVFAAAAVAAVARVFEGFERKPVQRPAHRWVAVPQDRPPAGAVGDSVELEGQEPAA